MPLDSPVIVEGDFDDPNLDLEEQNRDTINEAGLYSLYFRGGLDGFGTNYGISPEQFLNINVALVGNLAKLFVKSIVSENNSREYPQLLR